MCRWISYSGNPVPLEALIVRPENSLLDQSLSAKMAVLPTNADGFGLGWYGRNNEPGIYRSILPAWNDENLLELAHHIESPLFMAHIRRSTGSAVQTNNCHPFRYANWMCVHNGQICNFKTIRRELVMAVDPKYFSCIKGSTDSEVLFFLALTFGLQENPLQAIGKAVGFIEQVGRANGIEFPFRGTLGLTDSKKLYAIRYSTEGKSSSLFYTESADALKGLYPEELRTVIGRNSRAVVSEPLASLPGGWMPVEEGTMLTVENGVVEKVPFFSIEP